MNWKHVAMAGILALTAILTGVPAGYAAEEAPEPAKTADEWRWVIAPYVWIPELHGHISAKGITAPVDIDFNEVLDAIGHGNLFALMGHVELQHQRFSLFVDSVQVWAKGDASRNPVRDLRVSAKLTSQTTMVQFGTTYRFFEHESPAGDPLWIEGIVGGRFWYLDNNVKVKLKTERQTRNARADATIDWAEPLFGIRGSVPLGIQGLNLNFWDDIGGFGAGSDLTWNAQGIINYRLPWKLGSADVTVGAGYRAIDFDFKSGAGGQKKQVKLDLRGPLIGVAFSF